MIRRIAGVLLVAAIGLLILVFAAGTGRFGTRPDAGVITGPAIDPAFIAAKEASVRDGALAVGAPEPKQILFGAPRPAPPLPPAARGFVEALP